MSDTPWSPPWPQGLDETTQRVLEQIVLDAQTALGPELHSVILFGSAAEGRLRATSDVNVIFVLRRFDLELVTAWRASLQASAAAIDLRPMLLLTSEVQDAAESFAVKFSDIAIRRRVIFGPDPFADLSITREGALRRVRQVLLNLALRLRQAALLFNETGQTAAITDALGPLRASAMVLLQLDNRNVDSPRDALDIVASELGPRWTTLIEHIRELREKGTVVDTCAAETLLEVTQMTEKLLTQGREQH